jgi:hypothetical protein
MSRPLDRRRSRRAALLQLAAHALRRMPGGDRQALVRELEASAVEELVPLPRDHALPAS